MRRPSSSFCCKSRPAESFTSLTVKYPSFTPEAETLAYSRPSLALPLPADWESPVAARRAPKFSSMAETISGVMRSDDSGCFMAIMLIMSSLDTSRDFSCKETIIVDAPRSLIVPLI